jgi:hypothetical protein
LENTKIDILPMDAKKEKAYDEQPYITPGMPIKMDVEKNAWFKIGVSVQNPTQEDITVYVNIHDVDVRIE